MRAMSVAVPPTRSRSTEMRLAPSTWAASFGRNDCSASPATVPTSTRVRLIVFWSRSNTARCTSSAARWNSVANAPPPTIPDVAPMMSGRAASSSERLRSTTWSVTRSATRSRTLGSFSVAVARFANCSESTIASRR